MENIRLKTLISTQKTSVLGLEPNSNLSNSTTLGQEAIDVFLEGPRAQIEEERRKVLHCFHIFKKQFLGHSVSKAITHFCVVKVNAPPVFSCFTVMICPEKFRWLA